MALLAHLLSLFCLFSTSLGDVAAPEISFVITTHHTPIIYLRQTLHSIVLAMGGLATKYEVALCHVGPVSLFHLDALRMGLGGLPHSFLDGQPGDSLSAVYERGVEASKGKYIIFLDETMEITNPTVISTMKLTFEASPEVGVLGAKILFPDQTIYHAGLSLILKPRRTEFWRGQDQIVSFARYQGYPSTYPIKSGTPGSSTVLVDQAFLMTTKKTFLSVGGFPKTFSTPTYVVSHFNLLVKNASFAVEYLDQTIGVFHGTLIDHDKKLLQSDSSEFDKLWGKQYRTQIESTLQFTNLTLHWNTHCSEKKIGDTIQSIDFMLALYSKVPIVLEVENEDECVNVMKQIGIPVSTITLLSSIMNVQSKASSDRVLVLFNKAISAWNSRMFGSSSWDSEENRNPSWTSKAFDYVIGFTSSARNMIPSLLVQQANKMSIQEIWVPSNFALTALSNSGVNASKLKTCPVPFNNHLFDSSKTIPLYAKDPHTFTFLSVFPWNNQVDWKSLLRALVQEFAGSTKPAVKLLLLSKLSEDDLRQFKSYYLELLAEFASRGLPPRIDFVSPHFPYAKLASLYASVDAFVRVAHGESWGMPFVEALSMNIPCIGLGWSSDKEYLNGDNAYLLTNTSLVDVQGGGSWMSVDPNELSTLMRIVVNTHYNTTKKWETAKPIVEKYSIRTISTTILSKLRGIQSSSIPLVRTHKQANPNLYTPPSPPPYTPSWSSGSYNPSYSSYTPSYTPSFAQNSQKSDFVNGMKRIKIND